MEVMAPPRTMIGTIEQQYSFCCPRRFSVINDVGVTVLEIRSPVLMCKWGEVDFKISFVDGRPVGTIRRRLREGRPKGYKFEVEFPKHWDVRMKAVLFGAAFLMVRSIKWKFLTKYVFFSEIHLLYQ